jgi:hypothetical protein
MGVGRWLLRLTVAGVFFDHGTQKLLGWFGGQGLEATAEGFEKLGLRPGRTNPFHRTLADLRAERAAGDRWPLPAGRGLRRPAREPRPDLERAPAADDLSRCSRGSRKD